MKRGRAAAGLGIAAIAALLALALPGAAFAQTTLNVNTTADGNDGLCDMTTSDGCTLRDAVSDAEADDTINVPAGTYVLSDEFGGELGFGVDMTVVGAGARSTIISGNDTGKVAYLFDAQVGMTGVTLTRGNGVGEIGGRGGAVYIDSSSSLTMVNSAVTDSSITGDGGGIYSDGRLTLAGTTISGNSATGSGGGVFAAHQEFVLAVGTSTISGNSATSAGGGVYAQGPLGLASVTIANNTAPVGGGIFKPAGSFTLNDTIVTAASGGACGGQISPLNGTHNLVGDATCPFASAPNGVNVIPSIGPLQNNGGPTDTHALLAGSPAIGGASPATCTGTDQRGIARPQEGSCDIGAFEYVPPPPPPPPPPSPPNDEQLPPPKLRKTVNVTAKSGTIRIKLKGQKKFKKLTDGRQIPVGSTIDARKGRVTLTAAANNKGKTATADFYEGLFKVGQTKGKKPYTVLTLTEKLTCAKRGKASAAAKRKTKRRLWGKGKGRFRTKGQYSSATVRGTTWLTQDHCDRTWTKVTKGKVAVRDFIRKKTIVVRTGKEYIARARKKR